MGQEFDVVNLAFPSAGKSDAYNLPVILSRRFFIASGILILCGCASEPGTTTECMRLSASDEQMECLMSKMFPEVVRGIAIGALAGAVLGGAVAFALSGNIVTGLAVGGIVGGVAGGVIAYYNFTLRRAGNDPTRALSDVTQDAKTNLRKAQRFSESSRRSHDEEMEDLRRGRELSKDKLKRSEECRNGFVKNQSQCIEVYNTIAEKLEGLPTTSASAATSNLSQDIKDILTELETSVADVIKDLASLREQRMKLHVVSKA